MSKFAIRRLQTRDVDRAVALHLEAFPDFYLTKMGKRFLRVFYSFFVGRNDSPAFVAVTSDGEVLGAVLGHIDPRSFYRALLVRRMIPLTVAAGAYLIREPADAPRLVRGLVYRGESAVPVQARALLSSICVAPGTQSNGVGRALLQAWEAEASRQGVNAAYLTTDALNNDRAKHFYEQNGWSYKGEYGTAEGRLMAVYAKKMDERPPPQRRRRILQVVAGDDFGGGSRVIADIATSLAREHEVSVLATEPRLGSILRQHHVDVIDNIPIRRKLSPIADLAAAIRIASLIRRLRIEIVHTHTSKGGAVGRVAAVLGRAPIRVHTIHNFAVSPESSRVARAVNYFVERRFARLTDVVTVVSYELLREAEEDARLRPRRGLRAIVNGIPDVEPVSEVSPPPAVVVYHGRLAQGKGIETLLTAASRLARKGTPIDLRIYGIGEHGPSLIEFAKTIGIPRDVFRGFASDIPAILAPANVCVQPSHREGLSIAVLEAMRAARCVIASDIPANKELLGTDHGSLSFRPGNAEELTALLERACHDTEFRRRSAQAGRDRYIANYLKQRMLEGYSNLFTELATLP